MLKVFIMKGRQRSTMLVLLFFFAMVAFAVPAKPGLTRTLTLTDGSTVNAMLVGDEYLHYWLGDDGKAYQAVSQQKRGSKGGSEDGDAVYQAFDVEAAKKSADERRSNANQQRARRLAPRKAGIGEVGNISGNKKGLIILVNFQDVAFQSANNSALYQRIANEKNFSYTINSKYSFKGSMYDYFYDQSDGLFELTFDVVGPYTVSHDCSYYGNNQNNKQGDDAHPAEMVIEALQLANPDVDFSDYDWDNDLIVEQVYVIYAGKGEADGGAASTIWPHEWTLASAKYYGDGAGSQTLDGVTIDTYACGGELIGNEETPTIAGIGTMCHEFSHCLGYPDFYDTDYSGGQGMGYWDLMCSGSYNDDGYQPAGYTSYERWVAGWKTPIELKYTQTISNMAALQTTGSNSYIIYNKGNSNEYYLLENRQKTGWDTNLPGAGLLILHVDYDADVWSHNKPNDDPAHQRMTWIAADNEYQYNLTSSGKRSYTFAGMKNDPFPYGSVNAFGKNTTPAATLYNKNSDNTYYLDSSVENITQNSDGTISFYFHGLSNVAQPNISPDGGRFTKDQTVTVTITAETGATIYYTTNGNTPTTASTLYTAPFTVNTTTTVKAIAVKNDEESGVTTATYTFVDPLILADESLSFSAVTGSSETKQLTVLTEGLTQDITLTLTDANNVFSLGTTTISKSLEDATVDVTFSPTVAGNYEGTITLTSAGAAPVTVPLNATATLPPVIVPTLTVTNVTATDARATWTECDGISSYTLQLASDDQFTTGGTSGGSSNMLINESFEGNSIPDGWTSSSSNISIVNGKNGDDTYCVVFKGAGAYLITPLVVNPSNVSFMYKRSSNTTAWSLDVSYATSIDGPWTSIGTVSEATTDWQTFSKDLDNVGSVYIKFTDTRTSGAHERYIDLVQITDITEGNTFQGSLIAEETVTGTSYNFTSLSPETIYYARVKGDDEWSNVVEFQTKNASFDPVIAYYQNADGKTGSELKTAMCGIIYNRTEKSYDDLWTAYQSTDVRSDGKIWDMYSNITNYDPVNGSHANSEEGSGFNREHSFPKSWFGGEVMPMYTDLHHLYPVDGNINTRRSNNPYGETNGEDYKSANDFSKLGACTYPGYTGKVFEPNDEYKGDFARTYFYMVTCYEEKLHDWYTNFSSTEVTAVIDGSTYPALQTWQLNMLMKWAKNDPVSEKERNRNNAVYAIQHNRNPFIDYPGLEEYIWGCLTTTAFDYDDYLQPARLSFSPSEATATIGEDFTEPTLTTTPANLTVTYSSSNTNVATVDASTGEVTLVAAGSTTITATFAGNDSYSGGTASYTLTVSNPALVSGETLLYESLSGYSGSESSQAMSTSYQYLDYKQWNTITSVFAGANSDAHANGGCLKFGSGSAKGSMTTGNITLTGGGTLTFYLKKYGDDAGKLNVTVTGATADVTEFTPASNWTLCTVNLSKVTGNVSITLATTSKRAYVDEIKLTSNGTLDLADDDDNASIIAAAADNGGKFNVTLKDRTLYRDGKWNTLCLPFNFDLDAYESPIDGRGLTVMAFNESTFDNSTLTLDFTTVYDGDTNHGNLVAGTPYLIKWNEDTTNPTITDPVFYGVTIDATTHNKTCDLGDGKSISFCGTYGQLTYDKANQSILFIGEGNTLYYPESGASIGAQRAYFQMTGIEAKASAPGNGGDGPVRAFVLNFGDDKSNGIENVHSPMFNVPSEGWYTLDGRRLSGKPTKKGIYVNGNRKVLIK